MKKEKGCEEDVTDSVKGVSSPRVRKTTESGDEDQGSMKRLRWLSAVEKSQGTVTGLHNRNKPRLRNCVEQFLQLREADPEALLQNLGFGGGSSTDDALNRIPDRFLMNSCANPGAELYNFMVDHPELYHLLPVLEQNLPAQDCVDAASLSSPAGSEPGPSLVQSSTSQKSGTMQRSNTFSTVMHGMRFLNSMQSTSSPPPDDEVMKISSLPSVLDFSNRKALARQGFYGSEYMFPKQPDGSQPDDPDSSKKKKLSAAQKRKQFQTSMKSRPNWSFTEEEEDMKDASDPSDHSDSSNSFDRGLMLNSFSDRFSSDSSLESLDSFEDERHRLVKQNSISHLRRQYQETLRQSMDGTDIPVFDVNESDDDDTRRVRKKSITEVRKSQVNRLMKSIDDDADYDAQASKFDFAKETLNKLQMNFNSTQSTMIGSPATPNDMRFSFEKTIQNDGSGVNGVDAGKSEQIPSVNIVVDGDDNNVSDQDQNVDHENTGVSDNPNELSAPGLVIRSDSCNTLVPQDSGADTDTVEGELTPRQGDISPGIMFLQPHFPSNSSLHGDCSSESTGSCTTLSTVHLTDHDQEILLGDLEHKDMVNNPERKSEQFLKPAPCPPQESFELEEISSSENADINGNSLKPNYRKGPMEKSASFQSDSSGFADIDGVGEISQSSVDFSKESYLRTSPSTKKPFKSNQSWSCDGCHDNSTQTPSSLPVDDQIIEKERPVTECLKDCTIDKNSAFPQLSAISYNSINSEKSSGKSVMLTVEVPTVLETGPNSRRRDSRPSRFVSKLSLDVACSNENLTNSASEAGVIVKPMGPVKHYEIHKDDTCTPCAEEILNVSNSFGSEDMYKRRDLRQISKHLGTSLDSSVNINDNSPLSNDIIKSQAGLLKHSILRKKRSKEALIASKNQTADWLLSNERLSNQEASVNGNQSWSSAFKIGRPSWASTPNLKSRHIEPGSVLRSVKEGSHSLDLLMDDEINFLQNEGYAKDKGSQVGLPREQSREWESAVNVAHYKRLEGMEPGSNSSSFDESISIPQPSLNSCSVADEILYYAKLERLVNAPRKTPGGGTKMPNVRFTPNFQMKNWMQLPKQKHLEEETRLMQHAVQRYKQELSMMETSLFQMYQKAHTELSSEERADVQELRHLWSEVRKEVCKMEDLLGDRLLSVMAGNNTHSPLDSLEIVHAMIGLLREQLYHQQMCIWKDTVNLCDEEFDDVSMRSLSSSTGESWAVDIAHQVAELKNNITNTEQNQKLALQESFTELKKSLLEEVREEVSSTQNVTMLQLQVKARDSEIRRLKMELMMQSASRGNVIHQRQPIESDV